MGEMFFFRTQLGTAYKRDYHVRWHRAFFVPRMDPSFATWERWINRDFANMRRALFNPFVSVKVATVDFYRLFAHWRLDTEYLIMAKQNGSNGSGSTVPVNYWVNSRLTEEQKREIATDHPPLETVLADFGALVFAGYRLSVVPDKFSDSCQASLVCVDAESVNAGCGVSARHPDIDTALLYLLFKVQSMGDTPWREFGAPPREEQWG